MIKVWTVASENGVEPMDAAIPALYANESSAQARADYLNRYESRTDYHVSEAVIELRDHDTMSVFDG